MEEVRSVLMKKLHELNLEHEELSGKLQRIEESSDKIVKILSEIDVTTLNNNQPQNTCVNNSEENWDTELKIEQSGH